LEACISNRELCKHLVAASSWTEPHITIDI
jgi:hypothetical protein